MAKRDPVMTELVDKFSKRIFGRSFTDSVSSQVCVSCGGPAVAFRDELSKEEYFISGFCQECQDSIFNGG